ncbi:MAG: sugar ABC transporter ATP-binding protein [Planctomycetota bacterium]|nr:sugar ABC transporter ATP-binding protein [Planctomycetota bacterium]MDA1211667.1 sugar ABC transporter ATP-binding protein [Planctomycetota bacterium]
MESGTSLNHDRTQAERETASPLLTLASLGKTFGQHEALKPLDLTLASGEILGLIGENGAGKSTLIKLLSGVLKPSQGEIVWQGSPVVFDSPRDALESGISTLHQELEYAGQLSVAENMFLGEPWPRTRWGTVDWNRLFERASIVLNEFGLDIDSRRRFIELSTAEKQETNLAVALSRSAKFVILDEPTASLSEPEVKRLLDRLRMLRDQGIAMIYVTHRLDEILSLTDRVAVLRDGALVGVHATRDMTGAKLVSEMLGMPTERVKDVAGSSSAQPLAVADDAAILELDRVSRHGMFEEISFRIHAGEIVGLTGLVGAGRSELARCIYRLYSHDSGEIRWKKSAWRPTHPRQALQAGLAFVPEERKRQGLVLDHSVERNISLAMLDRLTRWGIIHQKAERQGVAHAMATYDIRAQNAQQAIGTLSGGNQQKALLARWLETDPELLIVDEPTRGVDVGAKLQIHNDLRRFAARGRGVLLISSDWLEVLSLADRILVMNRGRIDVELTGDQRTEQNVILAASGLYAGPGSKIHSRESEKKVVNSQPR